MNKSTLFKKAHALTKKIIKAGDSYPATFALCLKHIYSASLVDRLIAVGGNLWENYGKKRIYFNVSDVLAMAGYDYDCYNTGNISGATLNGERISNSEMRRVLQKFNDNYYYDCVSNEFATRSGKHTEWFQQIINQSV